LLIVAVDVADAVAVGVTAAGIVGAVAVAGIAAAFRCFSLLFGLWWLFVVATVLVASLVASSLRIWLI
jgi:hypothetical protein